MSPWLQHVHLVRDSAAQLVNLMAGPHIITTHPVVDGGRRVAPQNVLP